MPTYNTQQTTTRASHVIALSWPGFSTSPSVTAVGYLAKLMRCPDTWRHVGFDERACKGVAAMWLLVGGFAEREKHHSAKGLSAECHVPALDIQNKKLFQIHSNLLYSLYTSHTPPHSNLVDFLAC